MAGKRNAGNKRPSMFEVAKLAGVSHQTVSRVINHSPDVSDATREKVQKAIDQLNGTSFEGQTITVNVARPREERSSGGYGGNRGGGYGGNRGGGYGGNGGGYGRNRY